MITLQFDLGDILEEVTKGLQASLNATVASVAAQTRDEALQMASRKLRSGLKHWEKGFSVDKLDDGTWIISISGKLANMMEDGMAAGEIKKMLLNGNRFRTNAAEGKRYVDVPIGLDANAMTGKIGKTNIQVSHFKNAEELTKNISTSDWVKGGIKKEQRINKRIQDIIASKKTQKDPVSYLTIRRVSEKSQGWPTNPFAGAHVLDQLDAFLERAFEQSLESMI